MAITIPTVEPTEIVAGDTVTWKIKEDADRTAADGWVLKYSFVIKGKYVTVTCSDSGDGYHLAEISAADSKSYAAGEYSWQSYITKAAERYRVNTGRLKVLPNFETLTAGFDNRSHWQIVLTNVEAVLENRATRDQSSYTINGRQLSRTPVADLLMLYNTAKTNVANEEKAERLRKGLGTNGTVLVRF